jgi:DNA/RNA-binding domain of Phe-tRNA-synthetase-like protein
VAFTETKGTQASVTHAFGPWDLLGVEKGKPSMLVLSEAWKTTYPGAAVGVLAMRNVVNPAQHPALDERKKELENQLRARYSGYDRTALRALPALQAYHTYYKHFKKTYHVQLQLESIIFKGKSIPRVAALVEAMFMAELKNLLLTAGHDLDLLHRPVKIDISDGSERYVKINGQKQELKADDMMIADAQGVISSVLYGPDQRTCITPETQGVFFTVYAPQGITIEAVREHLQDIRDNISLVSPNGEVELLEVYPAA